MSVKMSGSGCRLRPSALAIVGGALLMAGGGIVLERTSGAAVHPSTAVAVQPGVTGPASVSVTPKMDLPPAARALSESFATTARALRPSVVRIDVEMSPHPVAGGEGGAPFAAPLPDQEGLPPEFKRFFQFGSGGPPSEIVPRGHGTGSGVILDSSGDVVTNSHVVDNAATVTVTLATGAEIPAHVVGRDPQTDLAVVRLERIPPGLAVARLGNSDQIEVGDWVLAIGSPLGLDQTVTAGIVSGKGRVGHHVQMSGGRVRSYISTDAMINPGNSGGPLVNLQGEVVGINTLINTGPGGAYGFAIPINETVQVTHALLAEGHVRYPYIGVHVGDAATVPAAEKAKLGASSPQKGAFVSEVEEGGPAARAGLRPGDLITNVDGQEIATAEDVVDAISSKKIGATVSVQVSRQGHTQELRVPLGELPSPTPEVAVEETGSSGLALQTVTPELARSLGLPEGTRGAAVTDVRSGSPAARAGMKPGDVILEVDRRPTATADAAATAIKQSGGANHLVRILGEHGPRFLTLPTG